MFSTLVSCVLLITPLYYYYYYYYDILLSYFISTTYHQQTPDDKNYFISYSSRVRAVSKSCRVVKFYCNSFYSVLTL